MLEASAARHVDVALFAALPTRGLASLAPSLAALAQLRDLDISGNQLEDVSVLAHLPSLRRLDVEGNLLSTSGLGLGGGGPDGGFPALEVLLLGYNRLDASALPLLARLPRLKELDVSGVCGRCGRERQGKGAAAPMAWCCLVLPSPAAATQCPCVPMR